MKIARILTPSGKTEYISPTSETTGNILSGSIKEGFTPTSESTEIASYLSPLDPPCIFCVGQNYREHALELGNSIPELPLIFIKSPNTLNHQGGNIEIPKRLESTKVDYEAELAVVIGKRTKNVSLENALNHVFGYTIANDVTARDWQKEFGQGQFCQGKSFDTFCPLGPYIVSADELTNPQNLQLQTQLNGEVMQNGNTSDMIFSVARLIEFLSGSKTLLPGTLILTGTPSGVGAGRNPSVFLKKGDEVTVTIETIGALNNPVIEEPL
ncbi:MAG: fumarylacetoacetate hydrolase family protein [Verrucomicrobiota bacterium]